MQTPQMNRTTAFYGGTALVGAVIGFSKAKEKGFGARLGAAFGGALSTMFTGYMLKGVFEGFAGLAKPRRGFDSENIVPTADPHAAAAAAYAQENVPKIHTVIPKRDGTIPHISPEALQLWADREMAKKSGVDIHSPNCPPPSGRTFDC